jgi:aerobic carbon-monoxide dehydrogenase medium subunit
MYAFEIDRPSTLADALAALKEDGAQALSGGQTLIPAMKARLAAPARLVSLWNIPELRGICEDDAGRICIGAATTHGAVAAGVAARFPALAQLAGNIGDPAVRARGTIGGSVANNDPSACWPAAVLACAASVVTPGRQIAADDFFQGMFATALEEGEIVTEVRFPVPARAAYVKFVQPASRFAMVGVFVAAFSEGVRVAVTGASEEGVFRWVEAEARLSERFDAAVLEGLAPPADGLMGDMHATPAYRAHLVGVMTRRAVAAA